MKINNTLKKLSAAVFLTFIIILILHSCKKDNRGANTSTVGPPVISQAKAWYESTYPGTLASTANVKTRTLNAASNGIFDYTKHIKPDWARGASYTRYNTGVVELPIDPASQKISSDFKNMTNGNVLYNKKYSRSSFLLLYDGKGYQAYVMTIIADSAYVNNDMSKLDLTTYRKRDPNFSGVVVYFTPTGKFISSYGYKNGTLLPPAPDAAAANTTSVSQHTTSVATGRFHADVNAISDCLAWYLDTYQDGELVSSIYLYTTCSSSTATSSGGGGSPTSPSPTPCTTPPPTTPPADAARFVPDVPVPSPTPGGDGDGGLPPPVPPATPCPVTVTVADTVPDPCAQAAAVRAFAANAIIAAQNNKILNETTSTGIEYGTDENATNLTGNTYLNTPVTPGTASGWAPDFTWNSTNGYTVGYSHGHPGGTGPSPADVFSLVQNLTNQALISAGTPSKQFYENKAQVTTETATGNYIVTITNWPAMQNLLNSTYSTQAEQDRLDGEYQQDGGDYLNDHLTATQGDAGAYALMTLFSGEINIYYAPHGSTNYQPLIIDVATGTDNVATKNCP